MVDAPSTLASALGCIDPRRTSFFLDVDGTLLGFKDRPEDVVADAALLDLVERVQTESGGAVALVSGRRVDDLDRIMSPLVLPAGGVHGADLRFADGRRETFQGEVLQAVRAEALAFVAANPGLRLEDKGAAAFAVHFRQAPQLEPAVIAFLDMVVRDEGLMVQPGKMVAEVKPRGCDKGKAIEALMKTQPFVDRIPMFIGDDLTDEHGFETVNAQGGWSIKVGHADEPTLAHYRLPDPPAVHAFLDEVIGRSDE